MSYGIQQWGIGGWGGADFIVTDHVPADNSTGINRLPTISFTLSSQSGVIDGYSINLTVNSVSLITNGIFTTHATGTIDNYSATIIHVVATVTHAFAPFAIVTVVVNALNSAMQSPVLGTTWLFAVDNTLYLFSNYIVRRFERVSRVGVTGLDAPQNPMAIVELAPPPDLMAIVI